MDCFVCHKESSRLTTFPQGTNYNRSLKAHTILSTALKMVLIKQLGQGIVAEVSNVCRSLINDSSGSMEIKRTDGAGKRPGIRNEQVSLVNTLWLQYINITDILHLNIYAERTGCWEYNIHDAHQVGNKILSSVDGVVVEGKYKWKVVCYSSAF